MKWKKLGLVWAPDGMMSWARTHAMGPTPVLLTPSVIRVFITSLDEHGRGRPMYVDLCAQDPKKILAISDAPLLDLGEPGCFDDNGVVGMSVIKMNQGELFFYYSGFELCSQIRYRIFSGLAIGNSLGDKFERISEAPILDRKSGELFFRAAPFVIQDNDAYRMWYCGGGGWVNLNGKEMPLYDIRYAESLDGIYWSNISSVVMPISGPDEHGFGRPWVVKRGPKDYQMFYSVRRRSLAAYRLGYAESKDGISWIRKDDEMGLDVSPGSFDSNAIMYAAVIVVGNKTFCFYNGNNFGEDGLAVAELMD
jgi:hypothetical protein